MKHRREPTREEVQAELARHRKAAERVADARAAAGMPPEDSAPNGTDRQAAALAAVAELAKGAGVKPATDGVSAHVDPATLPPYPVEVLPETVRGYVVTAAAAIGCPVEMVAVPLLVNAGACLGRRKSLRLKAGFEELPILWGATVAPPGAAKSPAHDAASRPIYRLQSEALASFEAKRVIFEADLAAWQDTSKNERGDKPAEPILEHFLTTDATVEQLAHIVAASPGVVLVRDELVGWVTSFDAYRKGGDRQASLTAWSGRPIKVDRRSRDGCAYAERPVICVAGGVQPDMLKALGDDAGRDDGFVQRFLWSVPNVRPARWTETEVSREEEARVYQVFYDLRYEPTSDGPVLLDPEARAAWGPWFDEAMVSANDSTGLAAGMAAKLPNQAARLALVLHALADPRNLDRPLSAATMRAAIELAEYHRDHAAQALGLVGETKAAPGAALDIRVLRVVQRAGPDGATRSDLLRSGRATAAQLDEVLARLEANGKIARQVRTPEGAGRPAEVWSSIPGMNELIGSRLAGADSGGILSINSFVPGIHTSENGPSSGVCDPPDGARLPLDGGADPRTGLPDGGLP